MSMIYLFFLYVGKFASLLKNGQYVALQNRFDVASKELKKFKLHPMLNFNLNLHIS